MKLNVTVLLLAAITTVSDGEDTSMCGSSELPCRTLQYAVPQFLTPGAQFLLNPGDYDISSSSGILLNARAGIQGLEKDNLPVTLLCDNEETPCFLIDAQGVSVEKIHLEAVGRASAFAIAPSVPKSSLVLRSCDVQGNEDPAQLSDPLVTFGENAGDGADLLIDSCSFSALSGALVTSNLSSIEISGSSVTDIFLPEIGMPLISSYGPVTLQRTDFARLDISDGFGLIEVSASSTYVESCTFVNVTAYDVLHMLEPQGSVVSGCLFDGNDAVSLYARVGSAYMAGESIGIEDCMFSSNHQSPVEISATIGMRARVAHSQFIDNQGVSASAISLATYGSESDYVAPGEVATLVLQNCTVADNRWDDSEAGDDSDDAIHGAVDCRSLYVPAEIAFEDQSSTAIYGNEPANFVTSSCQLACDTDSQSYCHMDDQLPFAFIIIGFSLLLLLAVLSCILCAIILGVRFSRYARGYEHPVEDDDALNHY